MKSLLFASHNTHKVDEVRAMLQGRYEVLSLHDVGITEDIPEPYDTFQKNAQAKAAYIFRKTGIPAFADDSGLLADALGNQPGVLSARYAGPQKNSNDNMQKLLSALSGMDSRRARFITVIAFQVAEDQCHFFDGKVEGIISDSPRGHKGFGYDPIFIPLGFDQTFGELHENIKKAISHRAIAMAKFVSFLHST